jgi:hypothetical protein
MGAEAVPSRCTHATPGDRHISMRLADVKRPWRHPGRLSFVALAIGLGFIVWYFGWLSTEAQDLAYQIPGMLAPIAIVAGVVLYQPDNRRPSCSPRSPTRCTSRGRRSPRWRSSASFAAGSRVAIAPV